MPIYEYCCQACGNRFEALIRAEVTPVCPSCESQDLERLLSLTTVQSESTRAMALRAAKKRHAKQGEERIEEQRRYELDHD